MTSTCELPGEDFFLTLNGFDEIAIVKQFGADVNQLRNEPFRFLRALVFVDQRRRDLKDTEAFRYAQERTIAQLGAYFPDATPELDPDDPDTEAGKEPSASD